MIERVGLKWGVLALLAGLLALGFLLSLGVGRYGIGVGAALRLLGGGGDPGQAFIVTSVRLPRLAMACATGAALAGGGTAMQSLFRNPLVSPFVIGLSAGAALGAAIGIVRFGGDPFWVETLAFTFGLAAVLAAWFLSGLGRDTTRLLLFGIVIGSAAQSAIGLLQYFADPEKQLPALTFWMLGGLDGVTAADLRFTLPAVAACLFLLLLATHRLNLLALGEVEARSLGVETGRTRFAILAASTLMVTTCVAKVGIIGWIGLTVPHIVRIALGPDNRFVYPGACLAGALFLLCADDIARTATSGELPVGIVTSALGAPAFAALLLATRGTGWR